MKLFSLFVTDKPVFREDVIDAVVEGNKVLVPPTKKSIYFTADEYMVGKNYEPEKPMRAGFENILSGAIEIEHGENVRPQPRLQLFQDHLGQGDFS